VDEILHAVKAVLIYP